MQRTTITVSTLTVLPYDPPDSRISIEGGKTDDCKTRGDEQNRRGGIAPLHPCWGKAMLSGRIGNEYTPNILNFLSTMWMRAGSDTTALHRSLALANRGALK